MEIGDHQPAMWVKLMSGFVKLEYEHDVKTKRAVSKSRIMHRTHETPLFPFQNIKETNTRGTLSSPTAMRKRIFFRCVWWRLFQRQNKSTRQVT